MLHRQPRRRPGPANTAATSKSAATPPPATGAILVVLLDTGIRASELCDLVVEDYDTKNGRLHIDSKGQQRSLCLARRSRPQDNLALPGRTGRRPTHRPLFATRSSQPLDRNNRHIGLNAAPSAPASNANVTTSAISFAINFLRNGGSVLELQRLLGHERMETAHLRHPGWSPTCAKPTQASPADNWDR